jgi:hypothetical protein
VVGFRFVVSIDRLTGSCGRRDKRSLLAMAAIPSEDQPPLIVDTDCMKAREVAAQLLEVVAGRSAHILVGGGIVDHLELSKQPAFEIRRNVPRAPVLDEEGAQPLVPKAFDHRPFRPYTPLPGTYGQRHRGLPRRPQSSMVSCRIRDAATFGSI